jgi:hypothetical protein
MTLVNIRTNFDFFLSIFARISLFEHFRSDWAYAEPFLLLLGIWKFLFLNAHFDPIR